MKKRRRINTGILRDILITYGMTQQQLATKSGLSTKTLSLHQSGKLMSMKSAVKIAMILPAGDLKQKLLRPYGVVHVPEVHSVESPIEHVKGYLGITGEVASKPPARESGLERRIEDLEARLAELEKKGEKRRKKISDSGEAVS